MLVLRHNIRAYLHHLLQERQLAWSKVSPTPDVTCNVTAAAIRFFYVETLDWSPFKLHLPPRPDHQRLPQVLRVNEVERLFACTSNPKHREVSPST
jgi:hypothetical protein